MIYDLVFECYMLWFYGARKFARSIKVNDKLYFEGIVDDGLARLIRKAINKRAPNFVRIYSPSAEAYNNGHVRINAVFVYDEFSKSRAYKVSNEDLGILPKVVDFLRKNGVPAGII